MDEEAEPASSSSSEGLTRAQPPDRNDGGSRGDDGTGEDGYEDGVLAEEDAEAIMGGMGDMINEVSSIKVCGSRSDSRLFDFRHFACVRA